MSLAALLGFATIGSGIGLLATSAYLISKAALQPSIAELQVAIVAVRFFGITRGIFRYLERLVSHDVTFRLLSNLRLWFYRAIEPLAPARLVRYRSGDLLARVVADVEILQDFYLRVLAPPAVAVLVALLGAILLASFDPRFALVLLLFLFLAGVALPLLSRALSRRPGRDLVQTRAELNAALVDGIQGMADLLALGQGERYLARLAQLAGALGRAQQRLARLDGLHTALTGLLMNLAVLAVLALAIPPVSRASLDGVYLAVLVLAVMACFEAVWPLAGALQSLESSLVAAQRLFEIVDAEPAVVDPRAPLPPPQSCRLEMRDLRFGYEPGGLPALDGISLDLPPGNCLAVVGPSGAGKSTLAALLVRFWDYSEGQILLDGQDLRHYSQEQARSLFAVVSQHTHLFNATVRDNLLLARPEASERDMIQAAQLAQIHDFVTGLPQGYDTWIGEQGLRLSDGQRQRLAIARALLKDAPILVLDEPTANLDAVTERQVLAALGPVMAARSTLIITHRLVGLEIADEIVVLRNGHIVERGRHHDLVQLGGLYRRMWELQHQVLPDAAALAS
jgi:ATP-binding cassette subfamily C protein CydC